MRGAPTVVMACVDEVRIIPADAGSTINVLTTVIQGGDHPRGCGEHFDRATVISVLRGSSPRMRGARLAYMTSNRRSRIIPADAGST